MPQPPSATSSTSFDPKVVVAQPAWETALRAKARETLAALNTMAVQASPVTFIIEKVPVEFSWTTTEATFDINTGMYALRMPLPWITGKA
jgi:predicted membrane-bound mannosyltransferase